jgi:predicted nucleic acid-binding protein
LFIQTARLDRKLRSACERKQQTFGAGTGKKKLLALDTNLLFDLAADKDFAHTFREVYQERGYSLVVPPTAIQELAYCALEKQCAETPLALKALQQMRSWKNIVKTSEPPTPKKP